MIDSDSEGLDIRHLSVVLSRLGRVIFFVFTLNGGISETPAV